MQLTSDKKLLLCVSPIVVLALTGGVWLNRWKALNAAVTLPPRSGIVQLPRPEPGPGGRNMNFACVPAEPPLTPEQKKYLLRLMKQTKEAIEEALKAGVPRLMWTVE